jgi:hypothetical protein
MDSKGKSLAVMAFGFLFIVVAIAVAVLAVSGAMDKLLDIEPLPALNGYWIGIIFAIVLLVIGVLVLFFGIQGS